MPKKQPKNAAAAATETQPSTAVAPDGSVDPTLLTSKVKVGGKEYTLCFDLQTLAAVEHQLRKAGHDVYLLESLPSQTLAHVLVTFAACIQRFHPEIPYQEALRLPGLNDIYAVRLAIADAWRRSVAEPEGEDKKNPTQPGA